MDLVGLLRELSSAGISDVVLLVVIPIVTRYWIIQSRVELRKELRQEWRDALDDKSNEIYQYIDAKFEAQDAKIEAHDARFDRMDARFVAQDARFDQIDARFVAQDARFDQLDRKNDARAYSRPYAAHH